MSRRAERGSIFIGVMLMIIPACALVGLVTDIGWWYFTAQSAHAAAEAAALASVRAAMDDVAGGGYYACASNGLTCQSAAVCPTSIPSPTTSNLQNGCAYAISNGFTSGGLGGRQTVTIESNITTPAPTVSGVAVTYWVTVRISQQNPLTFLAVLGGSSLNVGVRATAAVVETVPDYCLTALDPSASSAVKAIGNPSVTLQNCGMEIDSSASDALKIGGSACVTAGSIQVVGGDSVNGCTQPTPTTNVASFSDPLGALAAPNTDMTHCDSTNLKIHSGTGALNPGNYCGGLDITVPVSLGSGVYNLIGGGLTCNGNCALTGSAVTIYNTCSPAPCSGGSANFGTIQLNGTGSMTLSAPTSGPFAGILFYEDRTVAAGSTEKINGTGSYALTGTLYFPKSTLDFSGGSSGSVGSTVVVADQVAFQGNSGYLELGSGSNAVPSQPTAVLIE